MSETLYPYLTKGATLLDCGYTARDLAVARSIIDLVRQHLQENFETATISIECLEDALAELPLTITEAIGE